VKKNSPGATIFLLAGIVLAPLGMGALIHPELDLPSNREEIQIGPEKIQVDTRRIIGLPRVLSGMIVLAGGGPILLGTKRDK